MRATGSSCQCYNDFSVRLFTFTVCRSVSYTHLPWITAVSLSSICSANVFSFIPVIFSSPIYLFSFNLLTGFLWSMVKAYSVGTSICHTTNILTIYRFWIVQRFKPPSFLFRSSLSRQDFYRWFLRNYSIKSSYTNFDLTFWVILGYSILI